MEIYWIAGGLAAVIAFVTFCVVVGARDARTETEFREDMARRAQERRMAHEMKKAELARRLVWSRKQRDAANDEMRLAWSRKQRDAANDEMRQTKN